MWTPHPSLCRLLQSFKALLLSNAAALLVIPAIVWSDSWRGAYLQLPWILVMTSQVQTLRGSYIHYCSAVQSLIHYVLQ